MPLTHLKPGKYYFTVACAKCGEPIPFAEAPSPEAEPEVKQPTISLKCPQCEHTDTYAPPLMGREQVPEK
jgi:endogenous inhibitor of DNA gyrase (YacG/DUF329 family)